MSKKFNMDSAVSIYKPDVEAFTKLWSSLRTFYEGTNVMRTISRLLNVYQPEDGVTVYAELLRTLHATLQKFDPKGFCTLASMVPPPKGASEATIEKVFYASTGHFRMNVPVLKFNNNTCRNSATSDSQSCCKQIAKPSCTVQNQIPASSGKMVPCTISKRPIDETKLPLKKRKTIYINESQKIFLDSKTPLQSTSTHHQELIQENAQKVFNSNSTERKAADSTTQVKPKKSSQGKSARRKLPEPPTRPKSERVAKRNSLSQTVKSEKDFGWMLMKRARNMEKKVESEENSDEKSDDVDDKSLTIPQQKYPTMDLTPYRKHCCESFMRVHKARIAVANSLAISSVTSAPGYYPYYINYINRQQHMMHHQHLTMDPYCQSSYRYYTYGQYRVPQPAHTHRYSSVKTRIKQLFVKLTNHIKNSY